VLLQRASLNANLVAGYHLFEWLNCLDFQTRPSPVTGWGAFLCLRFVPSIASLMLAYAPCALIMQTNSKIGLTEFVRHTTSGTLLADHASATPSAGAGSEEVCVG
jgi:hypothetical protein